MSAAEAPLQPVTVCEVLKDLNTYNGKIAMVLGRFSFRKTGRWLSEETCQEKSPKAATSALTELTLAYDPKTAPKLSPVFEIDGVALRQKLKLLKARTALREFRFGSADYDRWAVVYGRVETRPAPAARPAGGEDAFKIGTGSGEAPAQLFYRGDGVIVFLDNLE